MLHFYFQGIAGTDGLPGEKGEMVRGSIESKTTLTKGRIAGSRKCDLSCYQKWGYPRNKLSASDLRACVNTGGKAHSHLPLRPLCLSPQHGFPNMSHRWPRSHPASCHPCPGARATIPQSNPALCLEFTAGVILSDFATGVSALQI